MKRLGPYLWIAVFVGFVGDMSTTYLGLEMGLTEQNPIVQQMMEKNGFSSLVRLKVIIVGVGVVMTRILSDEIQYLVPLAFAFAWILATVLNIISIMMVA